MDRELICEIDVESVRFNCIKMGEWEIVMVRDGEENVYHYTSQPDSIYDQLLELGDIEHE